MLKLFFYWLFNHSKTLQDLCSIRILHKERELRGLDHKDKMELIKEIGEKFTSKELEIIERIKRALSVNQNRALRRKWKRITENKNSPFYIYQ